MKSIRIRYNLKYCIHTRIQREYDAVYQHFRILSYLSVFGICIRISVSCIFTVLLSDIFISFRKFTLFSSVPSFSLSSQSSPLEPSWMPSIKARRFGLLSELEPTCQSISVSYFLVQRNFSLSFHLSLFINLQLFHKFISYTINDEG